MGRFSPKLALFRSNTGGNEPSNTPGVVEHADRARSLSISRISGSAPPMLPHLARCDGVGFVCPESYHSHHV